MSKMLNNIVIINSEKSIILPKPSLFIILVAKTANKTNSQPFSEFSSNLAKLTIPSMMPFNLSVKNLENSPMIENSRKQLMLLLNKMDKKNRKPILSRRLPMIWLTTFFLK